MKRIDDERIQFYLKHEALIEEWRSVRDDARSAAHRFYLSLAEDLESASEDTGDDVMVWVDDQKWGRVGLCRESWLSDEGTPLAFVNLEWRTGRTGFREGWRVAGVRCEGGKAVGVQLRAAVRDLVRDKSSQLGFPNASRDWPAQKNVPGAGDSDYWLDLDPYRAVLIEEILQAWETLSGTVDEALRRLRLTP